MRQFLRVYLPAGMLGHSMDYSCLFVSRKKILPAYSVGGVMGYVSVRSVIFVQRDCLELRCHFR